MDCGRSNVYHYGFAALTRNLLGKHATLTIRVNPMSKCPNMKINLTDCPCTYSCDTKGKCCECIRSHRAHKELPACYFPPNVEKTYDRSIRKFISLQNDSTPLSGMIGVEEVGC
jgi:hypothetical protein